MTSYQTCLNFYYKFVLIGTSLLKEQSSWIFDNTYVYQTHVSTATFV